MAEKPENADQAVAAVNEYASMQQRFERFSIPAVALCTAEVEQDHDVVQFENPHWDEDREWFEAWCRWIQESRCKLGNVGVYYVCVYRREVICLGLNHEAVDQVSGCMLGESPGFCFVGELKPHRPAV